MKNTKRIAIMIITIMAIISIFTSALATSAVLNTSTRAYLKPSTSSRSANVKKGTTVNLVRSKSGWSEVKYGKYTGYIPSKYLTVKQPKQSSTSWKSKVVALDWSKGSSSLKKGSYGYIYDIKSGQTIKIKRMGGHNHMDIEPATTTDTAKLLKASGGKWSWNSRSVILYTGGKYIAAAINTMPHGDQTITSNGYNGQFCLHLVGSKTHGSNSVNENHQSAIKSAYKWAH